MNNTVPPSQMEQQLRDMNEALLVSSLKQHELAEQAQKAEAALREIEHRQRFVMGSMPQKIFTAQPNGDVDYFNPQWTEFTGLTFEQIKGWGWKQFIHPDDLEETVRRWKHSVASGEFYFQEHRFRRADGEYRWHVSRARPMRDEAGRVLLWVGSNTEVHDIKQTEAALRASEIRYRRLFESAKDGILLLDAHTGKITDANACMGELMETEARGLLGKELWQIGLFGDKSASEAAVRELQEKGYIRYEHLPLGTDRGRRIEVEVIANVYREGQQSVAQCNIRDITERNRLERQSREQTAELSDLHRRKDEFLAMLSHELRNPLAPISNAVQMLRLQRGRENPIEQQARGIIERQVGQLKHIVDDLLEISRISTGRVQLRQERIAVAGIVERAVETAHPLIEQRRHELTVSLPPQPIWLHADAARLEQGVVNLLTNAAKYTEESGHLWLTVEVEGVRGQGSGVSEIAASSLTPDPWPLTPSWAVLRVRDTGMGIAPELLPRIFDLFTQADRSLDRSQGGLGIGLCLVQRLVELHGGTVEVYSVLGQGSEFVVRLPLWEEKAGRRTEESNSIPPSSVLPPPSLRVLVVDDNVDAAESLAILLRASGYDVRVAHDGLSAVEAALEYRPDVLLLDIGLPGLNGFEVAKRIRRQPTLKRVVLAAMTGYGQQTDRQQSREAGFDHHLVKPADFEQVRKLLATIAESPAR